MTVPCGLLYFGSRDDAARSFAQDDSSITLLDLLFGVVAVAGDDRIFEGLVFFVLHLQGFAFTVDERYFDLAVAAVVAVVGGAVGEDVLVADGVINLREDVGQLALEDGAKAHAAGHGGEGLELVLGLEIVELAHGGAATHGAAAHFVDEGSGTDGEDGDVGGGLDLGENLVESELGEGVLAAGDEDDVFAAFDAAGAIESFVEGVEDVGLGESGDDEGVQRVGDLTFVVGEVGEDVGAHVEGDDGDVVIFAHGTEEAVSGIAHVVDEVVAVGCELEQHDGGDRGLGHAETGDVLGHSVFGDQKISGLEAGDELVGLVEDDVDVEIDDGDVDAQGVGFVVGVLDLGFGRGDGDGGLVGILFLLEDDGSVIGLGAVG